MATRVSRQAAMMPTGVATRRPKRGGGQAPMLYYCAYTWNPGVTIEEVGPAILEQHDAGTLHPEWIRGYYGLVGGGAGFLILEVEDPHALNEMLAPSMRYMTWDI